MTPTTVFAITTFLGFGAQPGSAGEREIREWLGRANSWAIFHPRIPSENFNVWLADGKKFSAPEPVLRDFLQRRDPTVDLPLVAYALGFFGNSKSTHVLIGALDSEVLMLRLLSAASLGELRDVRAVEPLGKLYLVEPDENVRLNIVVALSRIGGAAALNYLNVAAAKDDDPFVAETAAEGLRDLACAARLGAQPSVSGSCCAKRFGLGRVGCRRRAMNRGR